MLMLIECAWCHKKMGTKNCSGMHRDLPPVTHSICPSCYEAIQRSMLQLESANDRPKYLAAGASSAESVRSSWG